MRSLPEPPANTPPEALLPPLLPLRNPLRNNLQHQQKRRDAMQNELDDSVGPPTSSASPRAHQVMIPDMDKEVVVLQTADGCTIHKQNKCTEAVLAEDHDDPEVRTLGDAKLDGQERGAHTALRSLITNGLCSSCSLTFGTSRSTGVDQRAMAVTEDGEATITADLRRKSSDTHWETDTTISSYDGNCASSSHSSLRDSERYTYVGTHTSRPPEPPNLGSRSIDSLQYDQNGNRTPSTRAPTLSPFPPTSPTTGMREYTPLASPSLFTGRLHSPLDNGRDVYGNYIPSKTRDYMTSQSSLPILPDMSSPKRDTTEGDRKPKVRLRRG